MSSRGESHHSRRLQRPSCIRSSVCRQNECELRHNFIYSPFHIHSRLTLFHNEFVEYLLIPICRAAYGIIKLVNSHWRVSHAWYAVRAHSCYAYIVQFVSRMKCRPTGISKFSTHLVWHNSSAVVRVACEWVGQYSATIWSKKMPKSSPVQFIHSSIGCREPRIIINRARGSASPAFELQTHACHTRFNNFSFNQNTFTICISQNARCTERSLYRVASNPYSMIFI